MLVAEKNILGIGAARLDEAGAGLTAREIDILRFLARGHSNRDLADRLAVSQNTVKFHLRNVFAKAAVTSRGELARLDLG